MMKHYFVAIHPPSRSNIGMFKKITIIGDGAMGTVCAMLLCEKGLDVTMWGYDAAYLKQVEAKRENVKFLPGYTLPRQLSFQTNAASAMAGI